MDLQQLEVLEQRITRAVELIEKFKTENGELQEALTACKAAAESQERVIQQLKEENQNLRLLQSENSLGKEKEERIRNKVEQMLSKLDELQGL